VSALVGCSGSNDTSGAGGSIGVAGSGGVTNAGGNSTLGGGPTVGGTKATGGIASTGGSVSAGGIASTGGNASIGGITSTGGSASVGGVASTGGTKTTGGASSTGGAKNTGGTATVGGSTSTGGTKNTGGTATVGGSKNTGGSSGTGGSGNIGGLDACGNAKGQLFPPSSIWNTAVDTASVDSESAIVTSYLQTNHTDSRRFQIDFGIKILTANASTPHQAFTPTGDFYTPDCDPAPIPKPAGGSIEGETGYACTGDGDCHLLVIDTSSCRLYEMWRTNFTSTSYQGGCQAIWDLTRVYPANMRGDYCTSADAAGLPMSAHMFGADEIQAGVINHAIRFILPNGLMRQNIYVHPATHSTDQTSGPAAAPPYGTRLRLKAAKDISGLTTGAQVVAKALKKYGMILSDGGNLTFTATADDYTTAKWANVNLSAQDLKPLQWSDFEMVDGGTRMNWQDGDCPHVPITQ
jgi:serine/threonine-protein kinase